MSHPPVTAPVIDAVLTNPLSVLLEEPNPILRARAHLALGQRALDSGNLEVASDHLQEAASLDPTDELTRKLLQQIQDGRQASRRRRRSWWPF